MDKRQDKEPESQGIEQAGEQGVVGHSSRSEAFIEFLVDLPAIVGRNSTKVYYGAKNLPDKIRNLRGLISDHFVRRSVAYSRSGIITVLCILAIIINGAYISMIPERPIIPQRTAVQGEAFTQTIINLIQDELDRTWTPSSPLYSWWMDNLPEFQLAQHKIWQYTLFALSEQVARIGTNGEVNDNARLAFSISSIPMDFVFCPSSRDFLRLSIHYLEAYKQERLDRTAIFELRSDNLQYLVGYLVSRMADVQNRMAQETAGDKYVPSEEGEGDSIRPEHRTVKTSVGFFTADNTLSSFFAKSFTYGS